MVNSDSAAGLNHVVSLDLGKSKKATFLILTIFSNMEFISQQFNGSQIAVAEIYGDMYNTISIKNKVLQQKKCRKLSIAKIDKKIYAIKPFKPLVLNSSEIWIPLEIRSCQCTKKNRELRNSR